MQVDTAAAAAEACAVQTSEADCLSMELTCAQFGAAPVSAAAAAASAAAVAAAAAAVAALALIVA